MAKRGKSSAEQEQSGPGHNSGMNDEDRRVLFFMNRNDYVKALAVKKAADAALKNVGKQIKSDLGKHGLDQIKEYERARTPEGEAEIKAEEAARRQAWAWAGMPVNTQADMFEDLAPLDERAFQEGEEAGLRGDTLNNPYDLNSTAGRQYEDGWKSGQAKLGEGIKQKAMATADERIIGDAADEDPFVVVGLGMAKAWPHEAPTGWQYDAACCSGIDCQQAPKDDVKETPQGYRLSTGEIIAYNDHRIHRSKDEFFHECKPGGDMSSPRSFCLYVPDRGY